MTGLSLRVVLLALLLTPQAATAQNLRQNAPGQFDFYVLSLSWSPSFCAGAAERGSTASAANAQCGPRPYSFVVHGLWPQYEKGFPEYCQLPAPRLDRAVVSSMLDLMPAPRLIFNEWDRHGTCSGLSPRAYFETVRKARATVKIPPEYTDLKEPLGVTPGAAAEAFIKAKAVAKRDCNRLRQQTFDRGAALPVEGSAFSRLSGNRETQLQPRSTDYAADAWQLSVRRVRSLLRAGIQFGAPKG
jgi:ribonuclease T2